MILATAVAFAAAVALNSSGERPPVRNSHDPLVAKSQAAAPNRSRSPDKLSSINKRGKGTHAVGNEQRVHRGGSTKQDARKLPSPNDVDTRIQKRPDLRAIYERATIDVQLRQPSPLGKFVVCNQTLLANHDSARQDTLCLGQQSGFAHACSSSPMTTSVLGTIELVAVTLCSHI